MSDTTLLCHNEGMSAHTLRQRAIDHLNNGGDFLMIALFEDEEPDAYKADVLTNLPTETMKDTLEKAAECARYLRPGWNN